MKPIKIFFSAFIALFLGVAVQSATGLNGFAVAGTLMASGYALPYLVAELPKGISFMAVSPDVSLIAGYAGDHKGELLRRMVLGMEVAKHVTILPNVKDQTPLISLAVTKGLRPYTLTPTFESELQYKKRTLTTGLGKKEFLIDPQLYRNTYLSKYMDPAANSKRIPFEQFANETIIQEFGNEINEAVPFFGLDKSRFSLLVAANVNTAGSLVYVDTTASQRDYYRVVTTTIANDTPTSAPAKFEKINGRAVADGLQIHITEAISASTLTPVTTGAINNSVATTTGVEVCKKVYRALDPGYRKEVVMAYMSFDSFDKVNDAIEEKMKYVVTDPSTEQVMENAVYVPGTNRKLIAVGCGWMGSSARIIVTPKSNVIMGCDLLSDANTINTNAQLWGTEMGLLFNPGINFALMDAVRVNDQA